MKVWIHLLSVFAFSASAFAGELNFDEAARIVIQAGGRKKPLETFAAESLQTISGRRTFADQPAGRRLEAMDVLFSIWFETRDWKQLPIILVSSAALRDRLGLHSRERLYSFEELLNNHALSEFYQAIRSKRARQANLTPIEKEAEIVINRIEQLGNLAGADSMTIVPDPKEAKGTWVAPSGAAQLYGLERAAQVSAAWKKTSNAYRARDPQAFTAASRELRQTLASLAPAHYPSSKAVAREVHYNRLHPFRWAWVCYLAAFFALLAPRARWIGLGLFAGGIGLQVYGFVLRCLIAGHVPVTNMYESLVWVSLGVAVIALGFYLVYRARIYLLTAAPLAVLGLILADMLPSVLNPSIGPLPPVLRDNFWLVTHVMTITLGYSAFALAMGLAHFILGYGLVKGAPLSDRSPFHHLLNRSLQVGVLLLAAGTILGGVWANYAWGRFWGWDPKETWALIALLLYIFAIHGRLAGWWGNFGLSVASAVCFNGILMAWYGVNFVLGKGLHSYGFGGGGLGWIGSLVALDLAFVLTCIVMKMRWQPRPGASTAPESAESVALS